MINLECGALSIGKIEQLISNNGENMSFSELIEAIDELKKQSQGRVTKITPPDDTLLDEYEDIIRFKFSDEYRYFLKSASNIFYGITEPLVVTRGADARGESGRILQGPAHQPRHWSHAAGPDHGPQVPELVAPPGGDE